MARRMQNGATVKPHKRKKRRAKKEALKQQALERAERRRQSRDQALDREAAIQATLSEPYDPLARFFRESPQSRELARSLPNFERLCIAVRTRAPRLFDEHYIPALMQMARLGWRRPLEDWSPSGKGKEKLFLSLARHLFALYPMPNVVWSIFFHPDSDKLRLVVGHLGGGGSLYELVKKGHLPLPLTRKQCHRILTASDSLDFLAAARAAQFADLGANPKLLAAWIGSEVGARVNRPQLEELYRDFVRLCAKTPLFHCDAFEPLLDYIRHRRREDTSFGIKGRSIPSLLRGMHEWHNELHQLRKNAQQGDCAFSPSGFKDVIYAATVQSKGRPPIRRTWRVHEILTRKELFLEGKKQRHCVASYALAIEAKKTSIWSLTLNEGLGAERRVTIELRNQQKAVVQIRGFANRRAKSTERRIIQRWASDNGLTVASSA